MAQEDAQGRRRGDVDLDELGGRHLGALAEVDGAQGQRQSPQAAALGELSCKQGPKDKNRFNVKVAANTVQSPVKTS